MKDINVDIVVVEDRINFSFEIGKSFRNLCLKDRDMDEFVVGIECLVDEKEDMVLEDIFDVIVSRYVDNEDKKVREIFVFVDVYYEMGEKSFVVREEVEEFVIVKVVDFIGEIVLYEFFVKWVGKFNIYNSWIFEVDFKSFVRRKLENYKLKYGIVVINICEDKWK